MKLEQKRNAEIDLVKAIAIILMLIGHSAAAFDSWLYLFHMSVFFVVAGYCIKEESTYSFRNVKEYILRRIKNLYLPCLIFNSIITMLHNSCIRIKLINGDKLNAYEIAIRLLKNLLFSGGDQLNGAMWFLRTMFISCVTYILIDYALKRFFIRFHEWVKTVLFFTILVGIWILPSTMPGYKFLNACSVLILIQMGHLIKQYCLRIRLWYGLSGLFILIICYKQGVVININNNQIHNPFYFILCAISGFFMCYSIAKVLEILKINKGMEYVGKHTLSIMMFHFLYFKLVTFIQIVIYDKPITDLVAYPVYICTVEWRIIYVLISIVGALGLYWCYAFVKEKIWNDLGQKTRNLKWCMKKK